MQSWHTPYLGLNELPRDISTFELQTFFTYRGAERELIEARRGNALKLGLALHIGFLRLSGRLLKSVRVVPSVLWRHLGQELGVVVRRYARRLASRPASVGARIKEPARIVEVACFLRYCLFTATDQAILMVQRRVADLWRTVEAGVTERDRWGILHAQPFVLNERQAGLAIEGVVRQEPIETSQMAVDTHGYTDFAMALARLLGFDLCPRFKELKQRHLFVPSGTNVPAEIAAVCEANVDIALIEKNWDTLVHLAASVMSGNASAVAALARFGSAARGDTTYEAGVQLGRLLRTAFLADYFLKDPFRNELRRVLNRGEAVNALKRAIYTGRVSLAQAKRAEEMQAVAVALSILANIIMT